MTLQEVWASSLSCLVLRAWHANVSENIHSFLDIQRRTPAHQSIRLTSWIPDQPDWRPPPRTYKAGSHPGQSLFLESQQGARMIGRVSRGQEGRRNVRKRKGYKESGWGETSTRERARQPLLRAYRASHGLAGPPGTLYLSPHSRDAL